MTRQPVEGSWREAKLTLVIPWLIRQSRLVALITRVMLKQIAIN
jgi:hypothetical protein